MAATMVTAGKAITTMTSRRSAVGRALFVASIVIGAIGCGSPGSEVAVSKSVQHTDLQPVVENTAPVVVVPETPPPIEAAAPIETAVPLPAIDGAAALNGALDVIAFGYHFSTTVTVDGAVVVTAEGDHLTDGTRLTLTGPAGALAYVITETGSWVLPENGEWAALADAPTSADPLAALRTPASVVVDAYDGAVTAMTVNVAAVALGIPGDAATLAAVQVRLDGPTLTQVSYSTAVDGHPAVVSGSIGQVVDPSPVVPPV